MEIICYIDESGSHDVAPIMTLGCVIATAAQWQRFDEEWNELLRGYGLTHFHSRRYMHKQGPYLLWPEQKYRKFPIELRALINRHIAYGFSLFVADEDYRDFYLAGPRPKKFPLDSKYGVCFRSAMSTVIFSEPIAPGIGNVVDFVIESGHSNFGDVNRIFEETKNLGPPSSISAMFRSVRKGDKKIPGLQAADAVAYSGFAVAVARMNGHQVQPALPVSFYETRKVPRIYEMQLTRKMLSLMKGRALIIDAARRLYGKSNTRDVNVPMVNANIYRTGDIEFPYSVACKEDDVEICRWPSESLRLAYAEISAMYDAIGELMRQQSSKD